jgi:Fe2+ transport system protein FeoA
MVFPLGLLAEGETAVVVGTAGEAQRAQDMGLRAGKQVKVLSNAGRGPLLLKVNNSRIAISRIAAMKILVRRTA